MSSSPASQSAKKSSRDLPTSSSNEQLLNQMQDELAACSICAERMHSRKNPPRILSCLHTFCSQCLTTLSEKAKGAVACPSCRAATKVADIRGLALNFTLSRMLEILEIQESHEFECDECDEGSTAISRCVECAKFMCGECSRFHERRKTTKGHDTVTVAEFKKNAQTLYRPSSHFSTACTRHNGEELKLYCETCEQLICRDCTMIDHTRPEHSYIFVHEAGATHRMEMVGALKRTRERVPEAEKLVAACDVLMDDTNARARDVEAEVRSCFQQQRYQLQLREEQLVAHVRAIRDKKEKIMVAHRNALDLFLANVQSSCDFTTRVLDEGTAAEVLATKVQIKRQLKLLADRELSDKPPVESSLHFYANTQALSEIIDEFASVTASSSFPPLCQATGDGLVAGRVGTPAHFSIITFDQEGEKRIAGGDEVSIRVERAGESKGSGLTAASSDDVVETVDLNDGTYGVSWTPAASGAVHVHVFIQVTPISGSPFRVTVIDAHDDDSPTPSK